MSEYFRKVMIAEEGNPKKEDWYFTDQGTLRFIKGSFYIMDGFIKKPTWYLKPVIGHILTDEELEKVKTDAFHGGYNQKEEEIQLAKEAKSVNSIG